MGSKGSRVQEITKDFDVKIKFPEKLAENAEPAADHVNGQSPAPDAVSDGAPKPCDIIRITGMIIFVLCWSASPFINWPFVYGIIGRQDRCEAAKAALIALIPVVVEVPVPYDLHRFIIGAKGKDVREMMTTFDVNIKGTRICAGPGYIGLTFHALLCSSLSRATMRHHSNIWTSGKGRGSSSSSIGASCWFGKRTRRSCLEELCFTSKFSFSSVRVDASCTFLVGIGIFQFHTVVCSKPKPSSYLNQCFYYAFSICRTINSPSFILNAIDLFGVGGSASRVPFEGYRQKRSCHFQAAWRL